MAPSRWLLALPSVVYSHGFFSPLLGRNSKVLERTMMKKYDKSALVFLVMGILIILGTRNLRIGTFFSPGSGLFPLLLGILLVVLSAISFFVSNTEKLPKLSSALLPRIVMTAIALLFAYRFCLPVLGYSLSTLLLFILLLKILGKQGWVPTVVWSVTITAGSYLIFIQWLGVAFPRGIIPF